MRTMASTTIKLRVVLRINGSRCSSSGEPVLLAQRAVVCSRISTALNSTQAILKVNSPLIMDWPSCWRLMGSVGNCNTCRAIKRPPISTSSSRGRRMLCSNRSSKVFSVRPTSGEITRVIILLSSRLNIKHSSKIAIARVYCLTLMAKKSSSSHCRI